MKRFDMFNRLNRGMVLILAILFLSACGALIESPAAVGELPTAVVVVTERAPEELQPAHEVSGLVFTNAEGTWWVDWEGEVSLLTPFGQARVSPDGRQLAYTLSDPDTYLGDIWLEELVSGERRNLTNTPDRDETTPMWIPGQPDALLFGSDTEAGMENAMYPTLVLIDGNGYEILDQTTGGLRGISPQGQIFFYGGLDATLLMYSWDGETVVFDPSAYGLDVAKLFQPVMSPDGRIVASFVAVPFGENGENQLGLAVFDLEAQSAQLMHIYQPLGGSMFNNDLVWSPDGAWLAFTTYAEPPASGRAPNLWVIRPDGSDETYVGEGSVPVWRYDAGLLAFQGLNDAQMEVVFLAERDTWQVHRVSDVNFPERIQFLWDWLNPQP